MIKKHVLAAIILACSLQLFAKKPIDILVIAGGHRFDTAAFFQIFREIPRMKVDTAMQPFANTLIASGKTDKYDVIVFYDRWETISESEKAGYKRLLDMGKGMVFLHHALVSYQEWDEFKSIIGGKYRKPKFQGDTTNLSRYKHDIEMHVSTNKKHPITRKVRDFKIVDEGYMNYDIIDGITPILTTNHPFSDPITGWTNKAGNSKIVYLMFGHDKLGFQNPAYLKLLENSILWTLK